MKIVWKDGYDRDAVSERLVASDISSKFEAAVMLAALRKECKNDESSWYVLVEDTHVLYKFEP